MRNSYAALQDLFVRLITEATASDAGGRTPGTSTDGPDAVREARTLLALTDGLTGHVLIGHLTAKEAEAVLHAHLAGLWTRLGVTDPGAED